MRLDPKNRSVCRDPRDHYRRSGLGFQLLQIVIAVCALRFHLLIQDFLETQLLLFGSFWLRMDHGLRSKKLMIVSHKIMYHHIHFRNLFLHLPE